jgi:hypothetical protein
MRRPSALSPDTRLGATNNRLSQHDPRIDFDADLAFVGHLVD